MYVVDRSANPFGSENTKLNVWFDPLPEDGVTETLDGGRLPATGTVQVPSGCQLLHSPPLSCAFRYTFFAPPKAALKVSATFTVRLLPSPDAVDPAPLSVHWLFCTVVALPGVTGPSRKFPASLSSHST